MNIAYTIWIENMSSPIIKGQVLDILKKMSSSLTGYDRLYIFSFQLLFFRPYSQVLSRVQHFRCLKNRLKKHKIHLITIPVIGLPRTLPAALTSAKWYILPLVILQIFPTLIFLTIAKRITILHCRSYPITFSAVIVKLILKTKVIFDPRSDYPEENVTAGRWKRDSLSYRTWKCLERKYLKHSDVTVAIAQTYVDHFSRIDPKATFTIIPNNVDMQRFSRDDSFRSVFRSNYNIEDDKLVFCYSGSLGNNHWHDVNVYAEYILKFRSLNAKHCFLFITPNRPLLDDHFIAMGIRKTEYLCISPHFSDVPKYLSAADIGMVFLKEYKIALAIKTVEYLSIGLPVLTNSNLAGAKGLVQKHGVGLVFDLDQDIDLLNDFIHQFEIHRTKLMKHCRHICANSFSNDFVANEYSKLYRAL